MDALPTTGYVGSRGKRQTHSATLSCQRKNKRHHKFCPEYLQQQAFLEVMEPAFSNFKIVRRSHD